MKKLAIMPLSDYVAACDAIREKTNSTDAIKSGEMADKINDIKGNGIEVENYTGEYVITPKVSEQTMNTAGLLLEDNITIEAIPYTEVTNVANGKTVNIA